MADDAEARLRARQARQARHQEGVARAYATDDIEVSWEPSLCTHVGECFLTAPEVFDPRARPWVRPDAADADTVAAVVMRCPTSALRFRRLDDGPQEEDMVGDPQVHPVPNGPLEVRGRLRLVDADGNVVREMTRASLCRCGQSRRKPFCDNSHRLVNFKAD